MFWFLSVSVLSIPRVCLGAICTNALPLAHAFTIVKRCNRCMACTSCYQVSVANLANLMQVSYCVCLCLSVFLSVCLSVCVSVCLSVCELLCLSVCAPVSVSVCVSECPTVTCCKVKQPLQPGIMHQAAASEHCTSALLKVHPGT